MVHIFKWLVFFFFFCLQTGFPQNLIFLTCTMKVITCHIWNEKMYHIKEMIVVFQTCSTMRWWWVSLLIFLTLPRMKFKCIYIFLLQMSIPNSQVCPTEVMSLAYHVFPSLKISLSESSLESYPEARTRKKPLYGEWESCYHRSHQRVHVPEETSEDWSQQSCELLMTAHQSL